MKDIEPYIIAFCCHNSLYTHEDTETTVGAGDASDKPTGLSPANAERIQYPSNIKVIEMPCGGKTEVLYLMKAFESGADGVCVITCPEDKCHFLEGNLRAKGRVKYASKLLNEIGIESDRLQIYQLPTPNEFTQVIDEMVEKIKRIGESPK